MGGEVRLAGLTDSAKALLVPLVFSELGRPTILLVDSNQRAEALLEPIRWFYSAVTGKPGRRVAHFPAHDVLPYENRSPHAEISEARAVALWRLATGEADLLIAPVQAALVANARAGFLSRACARDCARRIHRPRRSHRISRGGWLREARHLRDAGAVCRPRRHHRRFFARSAAAGSHRAARRHDRIHPRIRSQYAAFDESRRARHAACL